jgi:hypothetical protein
MWEPIAREVGLPWYTVASVYWHLQKVRPAVPKKGEERRRQSLISVIGLAWVFYPWIDS